MSLPVKLVNHSDFPLVIKKGHRIAQLHQACIQLPSQCSEEEKDAFLGSFKFDEVDNLDLPDLKVFWLQTGMFSV